MVYYLYCETQGDFVEELKALEEASEIRFYPFQNDADLSVLDISDATHIVASGTISQIKAIMLIARENNISLGIVPLETQSKITKILDLPPKKKDALTLAMQRPERKVDMFFCDDILVLDDVRIGNTTVLREFEYDYMNHNIFQRAKRFWIGWRDKAPLRHHLFHIKTAKEDEKHFSAVGIIALDYGNKSWIASALGSYVGSGDGKHVLAILSPTSLWQFYIKQPLDVFWSTKAKKIPKSIGFIKNENTTIVCEEMLEVLVDDVVSMQTPVVLRTEEDALALSVGEEFWLRQTSLKSEKTNIRLDNVPKDEERTKYLSKGLPLFEHASKEQYSSLFSTLREEGTLSGTFMTLLILSAFIATFGLFIDSGSVIIGAMLLAPLMQPIVSLSMGVLRQDASMQKNAARTIAIGVLAVLLVAALVAYLLPLERLTDEMSGRISPTILDMFVAIVSGVAAAYAKNNEKILSSLAGVAIAVALVPPIAVAGIGLGWGEWHMFSSAFLLFVTNLAGIVLAAAITFMLLGYSPIHIARKGLAMWLLIVGLIAMPLMSSFGQMRENARIQNILTHTYFTVGDKNLELNHIEVLRHKGKPEIRCEVISDSLLTPKDKDYLREVISKTIDQEADIIATFRYRL